MATSNRYAQIPLVAGGCHLQQKDRMMSMNNKNKGFSFAAQSSTALAWTYVSVHLSELAQATVKGMCKSQVPENHNRERYVQKVSPMRSETSCEQGTC